MQMEPPWQHGVCSRCVQKVSSVKVSRSAAQPTHGVGCMCVTHKAQATNGSRSMSVHDPDAPAPSTAPTAVQVKQTTQRTHKARTQKCKASRGMPSATDCIAGRGGNLCMPAAAIHPLRCGGGAAASSMDGPTGTQRFQWRMVLTRTMQPRVARSHRGRRPRQSFTSVRNKALTAVPCYDKPLAHGLQWLSSEFPEARLVLLA